MCVFFLLLLWQIDSRDLNRWKIDKNKDKWNQRHGAHALQQLERHTNVDLVGWRRYSINKALHECVCILSFFFLKEVAFACCYYYQTDEGWSALLVSSSFSRLWVYCTDYDNTTKWIYLCVKKSRTDKKLHEEEGDRRRKRKTNYVRKGYTPLLLVSVTVCNQNVLRRFIFIEKKEECMRVLSW